MLLRTSWVRRAERTKPVLLARLETTKAIAAPDTTMPGTIETIISTRPKPRCLRGDAFMAIPFDSIRAAAVGVFGEVVGGAERLAQQALAEVVDAEVEPVGRLAGRRREADRAARRGAGQGGALGLDHDRVQGGGGDAAGDAGAD